MGKFLSDCILLGKTLPFAFANANTQLYGKGLVMSDQFVGITSGAVHLAICFFLALLATYGSFRIFDFLTKRIDASQEINANNVAVSVMLAGMLFASALVLKAVVPPAVSTFQTYLYQGLEWFAWLKMFLYFVGYVLVGLFAAVASIWLAICIFLKLTHDIDELKEIQNGNVAVAIVLAVVIVIMGYFLGDGIKSLLEAIVPFPAMQQIQIM